MLDKVGKLVDELKPLRESERETTLKLELATNAMQSVERQLQVKQTELKQAFENIEKGHQNYSALLRQTEYDLTKKDEVIKDLQG